MASTANRKETAVSSQGMPVISTKRIASPKKRNRLFNITDQFSICLKAGSAIKRKRNTIHLLIDDWFEYPALRNYHGPSSIIDILRFRDIVRMRAKGEHIKLVVSADSPKRLNACFLIGSYLVLWGGLSPDQVMSLLSKASSDMPQYQTEGLEPFPDLLSLRDCIFGLVKFREIAIFDPDSLDPELIEFYEDPENGDMNWIIPGMFLAFAGPDHLGLQDFINYAGDNGIKAVVRLTEEQHYDPNELDKVRISHLDLPFEDGTIPKLAQVTTFLKFAETNLAKGAVAVHCRAGLGRTGTMIGCYLVRKYKLVPKQVIGFMRVMRPGMFLAKQPRFFEAIQWWLRGERPTKPQQEFIASTVPELANELLST